MKIEMKQARKKRGSFRAESAGTYRFHRKRGDERRLFMTED